MRMHHRLIALFSMLLCLIVLNGTTRATAQTPLTRTYYAAEPIKAGDLVMANDSAMISRVGMPGSNTESRYGKNVARIMDVQALTPQSALVCYQTTGGAYRIVAVTIDSNGKTRMGNDLIFGGYFVVLDSTHAVTFNAGRGDVRILTVNGTTLTMGPIALNLATPGSNLSLVKAEPDRILAVWKNASGWFAELYKQSGDQLVSASSSVLLGISDLTNCRSMNIATDRTMLCGSYGCFLKTSSDSLTVLWSTPYLAQCSFGNGRMLVKYQEGSYSFIGTATDSRFTRETADMLIISTFVPSATPTPGKVYFISETESGWLRNGNGAAVMDRMGKWTPAPPQGARFFMLSEDRVIMAYPAPGSMQLAIRTLPPFGDGSNYQGVAEQTVAAGQPCKVTLPGSMTRQFSNLKTGRVYYYSPNGPVLSSAVDRMVIGKAISPTEMLVWLEN